MGIVVVQSFGICVVVHGVFVAKTAKTFFTLLAVFRSRSFAYVVLNRQKPYKTSFVGGQVFCPQRFFVQ